MMPMTVTLTLDDETGAYLEHIAANQGRTPAEVAAWIVAEDLRREQAIDAELVARLDEAVSVEHASPAESQPSRVEAAQREQAGA